MENIFWSCDPVHFHKKNVDIRLLIGSNSLPLKGFITVNYFDMLIQVILATGICTVTKLYSSLA